MAIRPTLSNVVVKRLDGDGKTPGGILLPISEKLNRGEVIAVGPGSFNGDMFVEPKLKKGEIILFLREYEQVEVDKREYLIMPERNVLAVLE